MSNDYWSNRELQKLKGQLKDVNKLHKAMKKEYKKALEDINANIAKLFMKYSEDNNLLFSEANQLLSGKKFNEWKMSLKDYIKLIEETADEELLLELNTLAMKSRISRLEEMFFQIDKQINNMYQESYEGTKTLLEGAVKDSYYKSIFNVQKFLGQGKPFAIISQSTIEEVLSYPWSGANYSRRIWDNRKKLKQVVKQEMTQMIIQGKGNKEVAKVIVDRMDVDYRNAMRLVNTEHAYIMGEASARGYKMTGVEEYEILATLDVKTSKVCQTQDGKVYKLDEKKVGVNYPPFHPNCRTTTVPYFNDDEDYEENKRTARDPKSKTYEVPSDMKYEEWYDKHVMEDKDSAYNELAIAIEDDDGNLIIKREYKKEYLDKLQRMYQYYKENGVIFNEHALNRVLGQKKSKKIFTKEDVLDVIKTGKEYMQKSDGRKIKFKNGISVVITEDNQIVSVIQRNKIKTDWREV